VVFGVLTPIKRDDCGKGIVGTSSLLAIGRVNMSLGTVKSVEEKRGRRHILISGSGNHDMNRFYTILEAYKTSDQMGEMSVTLITKVL